jgi:hypothetical protein
VSPPVGGAAPPEDVVVGVPLDFGCGLAKSEGLLYWLVGLELVDPDPEFEREPP